MFFKLVANYLQPVNLRRKKPHSRDWWLPWFCGFGRNAAARRKVEKIGNYPLIILSYSQSHLPSLSDESMWRIETRVKAKWLEKWHFRAQNGQNLRENHAKRQRKRGKTRNFFFWKLDFFFEHNAQRAKAKYGHRIHADAVQRISEWDVNWHHIEMRQTPWHLLTFRMYRLLCVYLFRQNAWHRTVPNRKCFHRQLATACGRWICENSIWPFVC